jgi:hypothetical protein
MDTTIPKLIDQIEKDMLWKQEISEGK